MMNSNPWQVKSIQEFYCLKCPECTFFSKEEHDFKDHAVEYHPLSFSLFGKSEEQNIDMTLDQNSMKSRGYNDNSYPKQSTSSETACVYIKEEFIENDNELQNSKSETGIHNVDNSAENELIDNQDCFNANYFEPAITIKEEICETVHTEQSERKQENLSVQRCVNVE